MLSTFYDTPAGPSPLLTAEAIVATLPHIPIASGAVVELHISATVSNPAGGVNFVYRVRRGDLSGVVVATGTYFFGMTPVLPFAQTVVDRTPQMPAQTYVLTFAPLGGFVELTNRVFLART